MNIEIDLTKEDEDFIDSCIRSGRYSSLNDVFCSALRLLQKSEATKDKIKGTLDSADVDRFLQTMDRVPNVPPEHEGDIID